MNKRGYEYGTTPKKIKPNYETHKKNKKDIQRQMKINEEQKKIALKLEKRRHNQNVAFVVAIFFILLTISYRSSLINEKFNEIQENKGKLAAIEKTNGQLEVNIESSLNLNNIEENAKEKLGMKRLDNTQKVFVTLDKKDYVETPKDDERSVNEPNESWYNKIKNKILGK